MCVCGGVALSYTFTLKHWGLGINKHSLYNSLRYNETEEKNITDDSAAAELSLSASQPSQDMRRVGTRKNETLYHTQ